MGLDDAVATDERVAIDCDVAAPAADCRTVLPRTKSTVAFWVNRYEKAAWTFNPLIPENNLSGHTSTHAFSDKKLAWRLECRSSEINMMHAGPERAVNARMTRRGPRRETPLDPQRMVTMTARVRASQLLWLDEEAARMARETGLSSVNRSDVLRRLIEIAQTKAQS
jgi:hypothetical protein